MKSTSMFVWLGVCLISVWCWTTETFAEGTGFLNPSPAEVASYQELLPPGAVLEGTQVLHKINSDKENLHLLAAFYYGNPRQWKKIYQDNRNVIKNPNRLPVGQTIRIQVADAWKPKVAYQEWFNLATRNGEWKSGQPWQRAVQVAAPATSPAAEVTPQPEQPQTAPAGSETRAVEPTSIPAQKAPATTVSPAVTAPAVAAPAAQPTPAGGKSLGLAPVTKARELSKQKDEKIKQDEQLLPPSF
jgi:hypothetical protein